MDMAVKDVSSSSNQPVQLECSDRIYKMMWFLLLCLHLLISVSFCILAILYFITIYRESRILLQFVAIKIQFEISLTICILATCICLWNLYCAFQMCFLSIKNRRFCFLQPFDSKYSKMGRNMNTNTNTFINNTKFNTNTTCRRGNGSKRLDTIFHQMSKWTNVQGFYFDIIFNTREVIEILIQTIQLYRMTFLVSRKWISSLNVAIIFINCWSTPLIMKYVGNFSNDKPKKALGRFICILVDTLLDFSSCILIPFMVLVPYYQEKEQITSMQLDALYEATFMVNLAVELRLILSNSWIALLPVVLPAMSMNFCMENMKQLIIHQDTSTTTSTMIVFVSPIIAEEEEKEKQVNVEKKKEKLVDVHPYIAAVSHHSPPSRPQVKKTTRSQKYKKTIRFLSKPAISFKERYGKRIKEYFSFLHTFFLLLGMGIVMTHLFAINQPTMEGCQETVYPWFESRMSCSVLYINCVERQIKGKSDELELIFENSSEKSISALVFMHCPLFEMPTKITTFSNLFWMEIYNSTLEKWPKEAALRSHLHPIMTSLYMVHVNFTNDFPSGLLVDEMPPNLVNFQVAHSNLKTLPTELHTKWSSQMLHFYIEWSELTEVPATLASMNFVILSLVGNQIQTIPTSILAQPTDKLFFSYNPIKNFSNDDSIELREENNIQRELHLEYTNLMTLPFWLDGAIEKDQLKVFAFASPLCNNNNTTNDEHTRLQMCLQPKDPTKINQFPSQTYIASKKTTP